MMLSTCLRLCLAVIVLSTAPAANAAPSDLAQVKARGKLVLIVYPLQGSQFVAVNLDRMRERNLKFGDLKNPEEFSGIDIDLMHGFAKSLGVTLEVRPSPDGWSSLLPGLVRGDGDAVASELTITPERKKIVDFSRPYVSNWVVAVVREDSKIAAEADLKGKKAALHTGSSHAELLKQTVAGVKIEPTSFDLESFEAVAEGRVDFTLTDTTVPPGQPIDALHPNLKVAFRLREIGDGVAVRKGSDLLKPLNEYLIGLEISGELKQILERHGFGVSPLKP
jgi:ABC-type amino acid transport substrate-binding protein